MKKLLTIDRLRVGVLFAFAIGIRAWFIFWRHPFELYIFSDMAYFMNTADHLYKSVIDPYTFMKPIGYPLVLALAMKAGGSWILFIKWSHLIFSVLTLWFIWRAAGLFLGKDLAFLVLAFLCFDFPSISLSGFLMAETWFGFFIALLFYFLVKYPQPWTKLQSSCLGIVFLLGFFFKGTDLAFPFFVLDGHFGNGGEIAPNFLTPLLFSRW